MPKLTNRLPAHSYHKASRRGVVRLNGRDYYTGTWTKGVPSKAAKAEYNRLIRRWLSGDLDEVGNDLTIAELVAQYWRFAKSHYTKHGVGTSEQYCIRSALRPLLELYEGEPATEFGPKALRAVQQRMVELGWSRGTVNINIGRIRRMFRWAVTEEVIGVEVHQRLAAVMGLQRGRTNAREPDGVEPVTDDRIGAVLPHVPATIADMIRFQRLTGCRPAEVCGLRPIDIDRTEAVWRYVPASHKTEHRNRQRVILIGPRAQAVLLRYLVRDPEMFCFRPIDSEAKRRAAQHATRKTPLTVGNKPGSNRKRRPRCQPTDRYSVDSYRRAIERGCDVLFPLPVELRRAKGETDQQHRNRLTLAERQQVRQHHKQHRWSPNRLRHTAATEIRSKFGLESAQVILGHTSADVTQVYAERDMARKG